MTTPAEPRTYLLAAQPWPGADLWVRDLPATAGPDSPPQVGRLQAPARAALVTQIETLDLRGFSALMLPGVRDIDDVCAIAERCALDLLPVIDSARALDQVRAIAQVPGVVRLVFDAEALSADLGVDHEDALLLARGSVVLASRLAALQAPVDDSALPAPRARSLGFGARLCRTNDELSAALAAFRNV